jgi:CubicO group peptidase (beta-lactamase class C family)
MRKLLSIGFVIIGLALANRAAAQAPSAVADTEAERTIDRYMRKAEANGFAGSVLVARGDAVILAKGYGLADREKKTAQTAETVFSIGSITKQFTGAAILTLETAGKLSVTDRITRFFRAVPADKADITLHQLLTHTAGFAGELGDDYEPIGRDAFIERAMGSKLLFRPGERYAYSNVGFSLLGIIVELVSGQRYEDYLDQALFKPAGMKRTGYLRPGFTKSELAVGYQNEERWGSAMDHTWMADGPGWNLRANGGILSTVGDMHRWFLALRGEAVLTAAAKAKYFAPQVKEYPDGDSYYGYGWVIQKTERGTTLIWHNGGNGIYNAVMGFEPETGLVVVVSSNVAGKISDTYADRIRKIASGGFKAMDEGLLAEYTGTYRLESGAGFRVRFDENDVLSAGFGEAPLIGLLAGTGRENQEQTGPYDARVKDIIAGALAGDFKALAAAWGEPLDAVRKRATSYWGGMKGRFGAAGRIEVLGTADRPRNLLTYARIDFARRSRYFVFVWAKEGGRLAELRESDDLEREFEPRPDGGFFSPSIGAAIRFGRDEGGRAILVILKNGREVRAVKIDKS